MIFQTNNDNTGIITFLQARKLAEQELTATIQQKQAVLAVDAVALKTYEVEVAKGAVSTERFTTIMKGASTEAQNYAVSTKGATGSTQTFVANQQKTINALKNTEKASLSASLGVKALNIALNMGAMLAFSLAVKAVTWAVDTAIITLEEQKEKVDECASAYESAQTELSSITSELESQTRAMNDLLAKDKLTYAEQGQLEELQQITKELQIQKDIADRKEVQSQKDLAVESAKLVNKQYGKETASLDKISEYEQTADITGNNVILISDENNLSSMIAGYRQFNELLDEAYSSKNEDDIENFKDSTDKVSTSIWNIVDSLSAQQSNMQDYYEAIKNTPYEDLTTDQKMVVDAYKKTADEIKLVYSELSPEEWNDMEISNIFNSDGIEKTKDKLIEMAQSGELTPETIVSYKNLNNAIENSEIFLKNGQTAAQAFCDEIYACAEAKDDLDSGTDYETPIFSITDTIDQLNTQLKPAFDSLKSAYQDIFTDDGFTLENVDISMLDSIKSSIDSLNEMDGIEIDYSSFENLAKVLTDTSSASDDVQTSINTLATEIVNSLNPALKDVTGESYQLVQQMLESLGVQNAEQVMISSLGYTYSEYTAAKQECANAGFDLANATEEEIANFIVEQGGAENCGEALALLQLKKLLLNTTRIDQTSDINNILTLAGAAGVASESMVRLANAKLLLDNAVANNDSRGIAVAKQELIDAGQAAKDSVLDFKPVELDFSPASSSKSKGSGSKSEKDTYLESYKKERAELEHLHNMELITDKEFYDRLRDLNEKYFNDTAEHHEKYLDEYQSNEEKIFKGLKQVYQDSLEEHKSMMDSAASHAQRVLDKEIDKLKSDSKTTIKHYEQRIDAIDKEIDAKQGIIDKYQDELDAMELANQKRKDAIALQKAQYELDRVQNQRTIGQYQNGQKIYLTDGKAVRDAEDDRDEAEYNIKRTEIQEKISLVQKEIDALEAKQDRLQAKIDQENQALDAQIEKLEAYKERWAEIAEKQTIAQEEAAFLAICGAEGEAEILAMREGILQGFSDNYDAITTNLADLAQANADRMAEIASQMESAASRAAKAASDMARAQASMSSSKGEKYASGTKSAKRGLNLVAEEKPEAIIDNEGVRLITKPTLLQMSGGEQVLNGKETETLLDGGTSLSPRIKELLSRSQIESIGNFANMNIMPSFQHNVKLPSFDFSKLQVREQPQNIEVNIGDIKLDNVKDSHSLARDIVNRMPSYVIQEINKR